MIDIGKYMTMVVQSPKEYYNSLNQATIDAWWDNTNQIRLIKEESYPFNNIFTEHEVWVSTVSDVTTSTNKVSGNYISINFKDLKHTLNHRGQKYLYKTNGEIEDTYLCYDKLNQLTQTANTKLIMCNNKINWINKDNGAIYNEPIFVGWEMNGTNNQINKNGIVPERRLVWLVQGNDKTKYLHENQRFIISKNKAFKITQVNNTDLEHIDDDIPTLLTIDVEWCPILPNDNLELNIADYYNGTYSVKINESEISQIKGFTGRLTATTKYNDKLHEVPVRWKSLNENIVTIDNNGNYELVGNANESTEIMCYIDGNDEIFDSISVEVIQTVNNQPNLVVTPSGLIDIFQGDSQEFKCGLYINNILQSDTIQYTANWTDNKFYEITATQGGYIIKNKKRSSNLLEITFNVNGINEVVRINLRASF